MPSSNQLQLKKSRFKDLDKASDDVLLDVIEKLEIKNNEQASEIKELTTINKKVSEWLYNIRGGLGFLAILCCLATPVALGISWLAGGWATDNFYVDYSGSAGTYAPMIIYQEYDWGKDPVVSSGNDSNEISARLKTISGNWKKLKDSGATR